MDAELGAVSACTSGEVGDKFEDGGELLETPEVPSALVGPGTIGSVEVERPGPGDVPLAARYWGVISRGARANRRAERYGG